MLSREEAHIELNGEGHLMIARAIDKIYDSIGLCGECEFGWTQKTKVKCEEMVSECGNDWHDITWYCGTFERRQDDK